MLLAQRLWLCAFEMVLWAPTVWMLLQPFLRPLNVGFGRAQWWQQHGLGEWGLLQAAGELQATRGADIQKLPITVHSGLTGTDSLLAPERFPPQLALASPRSWNGCHHHGILVLLLRTVHSLLHHCFLLSVLQSFLALVPAPFSVFVAPFPRFSTVSPSLHFFPHTDTFFPSSYYFLHLKSFCTLPSSSSLQAHCILITDQHRYGETFRCLFKKDLWLPCFLFL